MQITGALLIGREAVMGSPSDLHGIDPSTGRVLEPAITVAEAEHVARACALAEQAFDRYRATTPTQRAGFLEAIADEIVALGDTLVQRASAESGLPLPRESGERDRTANQLRLFAGLLRSGRWLDPRIDPAQPERKPLARPDLRQQRIPLGPVAVFGASNFPLAFSVAGGDTASALAAGCPVVVKGHPAHPGTGELVGRAIQRAAEKTGMPEGVFSLLNGLGNELGGLLVAHPAIHAVGFTGSRQGGLALMRIAAQREIPIPVYAEMSAINPVYVLPAALAARGPSIAAAFADSVALGAGQFCTNPGLVVGLAGPAWDAFTAAAGKAMAAKPAATMLTAGIHAAYLRNVEAMGGLGGVATRARGGASDQPNAAQAVLFETSAAAFLAQKAMGNEIFGPASLLVRCESEAELMQVTAGLEGQLTATLQLDDDDIPLARQLLPVLERKAGRILANGYPTGVEVCHAMVHGGPFPATSDGRSTSVGTAAVERFLRPICYQDLPDALLPDALKPSNPLALTRLVDGEPSTSSR